jgi:flagellar biosynthesis/type III secretory pathway protein FliH
MRPIVIGRAAVPIVTTPEQASSSPELAVLSAIAHGEEDPETAVSVARAAFEAIVRLDGERATLYYDLIRSRVGEAARRALEELMQSGKYEYQSDFARKYYGEGRAEGRAEGEAIGRAEGRAEGEAIGRAEAVLNVLAARGIAVKPAVRSRVLSCGDIATLDAWLRRAVTVAAAEDIFES